MTLGRPDVLRCGEKNLPQWDRSSEVRLKYFMRRSRMEKTFCASRMNLDPLLRLQFLQGVLRDHSRAVQELSSPLWMELLDTDVLGFADADPLAPVSADGALQKKFLSSSR